DRIALLLQGSVVPALDGREAEAGMLIGYGMMPRALGECRNRGGELALGRWCRQQLADNGETELRPPLVNPFASCPITHAALPRLRRGWLQAVSGAGDERLLRI